MTLRTAVVMKTDIAGSTPRFRALLAADLQALLFEHRALVERLAAGDGGKIFGAAGDGYWLEFPSVTDAAKSAMAMQEELLLRPSRSDDRLSMRVVIGLGDVATQDAGELIGETLALVARIEDVTPPDEIYLTLAARLALKPSEIQTALVDSFLLKGFAEPVPVYRIEKRHRTQVIADAYILFLDLRGFTRLTQTAPTATIEHLLNMLDALINGVAREFDGMTRFSVGDSYFLTFTEAARIVGAAEHLTRNWKTASHDERSGCGMHIVLHRGSINAFRTFLYGEGMMAAGRVLTASKQLLTEHESGVFVTEAVRDRLPGSPWHNRLRPLALKAEGFPGLDVYRLDDAPA